MFDRVAIKKQAKANFKAHYGTSLGVYVLIMLAFSGASSISYGVGAFFLMPMLVGLSYFMLNTYNGNKPEFGEAFSQSFKNYARKLGGMLWMCLFACLWTLLFIVPGIIKSLAYSMTPYILADCPNVEATAALKISMKMTKGYKGDIFVMYLSFIGWGLLSALTCGVLEFLYVGPYRETACAGMYEALKKIALDAGTVTQEELS